MKRGVFFIVIIFFSHSIWGQKVCDQLLQDGIAAYNSGEYREAMRLFSQGMDANNKCNTAVFREWVQTCFNKMNATPMKEQIIMKEVEEPTSENPTVSASAKTASITKVWQEHNVVENGVYGMRIHVTFTVNNMLNQQGSCTVWFYLANGSKLQDKNKSYTTPNGQVAVAKNFTPDYANSGYSDFVLFIPYSELHGEENTQQDLKFNVGIFDETNKQLTISAFSAFSIGEE